jgi:hypothetical protein
VNWAEENREMMRLTWKATGFALLVLGVAVVSPAALGTPTPEIDPASGAAAIALLAGGLLVIRHRRKGQTQATA